MTIIKLNVGKAHRGPCQKSSATLFGYMQQLITQFQFCGRERTAETYASALRSVSRFCGGKDVRFTDIDDTLMLQYEVYLHSCGVTSNTSSFYMRILRAVYNSAVESGLARQCSPFRHVYTGVEKTAKRALPLKLIKRIKEADLSADASMCFARDMFMFSFYTRGMSFVDMAYLRKNSLKKGMLVYRRRKTGQQLFVKWEKCMQDIIDRYPKSSREFLLPLILHEGKDERLQYRTAMAHVNVKLKQLGEKLGFSMPLTMYVARHSWASAAKSNNVPVAVISEALGHESESTTQIYLASLETAVVDKFNRRIIRSLG